MKDEESTSESGKEHNLDFCDEYDTSDALNNTGLAGRTGYVDFPFVVTTTDKGNIMIVTDSETPGFRHHWSLHSRRLQKNSSDNNDLSNNILQRFACIKCKQQSRDNNSCMFASCLSIVQTPTGEIFLKTHPWTGIRSHVCSGISVDESDALILLRRKRQEIVKLKSMPKDAFDELMQEINSLPNWDEDKRQRVRVLIGSKQRNERTFQRCLLKGRRIAATATFNNYNNYNSDNKITDYFSDKSLNDAEIFSLKEELSENNDFALATATAKGNELIKSLIGNGLGSSQPSQLNNIGMSSNNLINNYISEETKSNLPTFQMLLGKPEIASKREFNFSFYPQRRIALFFLYLGWEFDGLVAQPDTKNTVEEHIFSALLKTRLIKDRESCQWTRCGRTDKGVSAFKQVAAVSVRSNDVNGKGVFWSIDSNPAHRVSSTTELNFTKILNGVLTKSIRIIAWCGTDRDFNARFNCTERAYTYIFPRANVDLNIINDACSRLIGKNDYRNFCHIDNNKNRLEMSYVREIFDARVETINKNLTNETEYDLLKLSVKASGFLWHQIRCIVTILYEIGCKKEMPQIVTELLNIKNCPARPQYGLSNELPLCLFDCSYPDSNLDWIFDEQVLKSVLNHLQFVWSKHQVKAEIVRSMINGISSLIPSSNGLDTIEGLHNFTLNHVPTKNYVQILKRPRCQSLKERIEKNAKHLK